MLHPFLLDAPMKNWFTIEQLYPDTFMISEWRHWEETHCYLLLGKERALLIDTGLGVGDLRAQVEQLTDLPVYALSDEAAVIINDNNPLEIIGKDYLIAEKGKIKTLD